MAILKRSIAPFSAFFTACIPCRAFATIVGSGASTAATAQAADSIKASTAAAGTKDPGYTITEVPLEKTQRSKRTHATAMVQYVKGHTKKLNPVARQVAGKSVSEALVQMALSPSRRAPQLTRAITKAVNAARGPTGLPSSAFMVEQAWTGKHTEDPRIRHHSKGRAGRASKRTSKVWVRVRAMGREEALKLNKFTTSPSPASIAALSPHGY